MKHYLGVGIVGNFANHLEQAGEASDFCGICSEENAPKGIFPFYVPNHEKLQRFCFDNQKIILPEDSTLCVQAEPEVGIECDITYENGYIKTLVPKFFMAFNDASVRNDKNAKKISQKKNFSTGCKGYGNKIAIDSFQEGGVCDDFSIASFIKIDGKIHPYGECSPLLSYSFFYNKLLDWLIQKLNYQEDMVVLEDMHHIIKNNNFPEKCIIAIGATRYTHLGETRFLQNGDEVNILIFNHKKYDPNTLESLLREEKLPNDEKNLSILQQKVVKQ